MRTGRAGIDLIKEFEGCRLHAYICPAGVLTIGYGHTSAAGPPDVLVGGIITQDDADQILQSDLRLFEFGVANNVTVDVTQNQFDALVSFAFNLGLGNLKKSTLLRHVNNGNFDDVPGEFMKWSYARVGGRLTKLPGLVRRRIAEATLWSTADEAKA